GSERGPRRVFVFLARANLPLAAAPGVPGAGLLPAVTAKRPRRHNRQLGFYRAYSEISVKKL
ncbi:MAG: hypothetical protein KDA44_13995, partial [Planctomycetales bacterium]|nr:hypothetical protein [Planctomycetales bacterium]